MILTEAGLSGLFPVLAVLTYFNISPLVSLFFATFFAMLFLGICLAINHDWSQLAVRGAWLDILGVTLFNAVLYYGLYFLALKYTSPNNASIIALLEAFFSYLFFNVWKKERLSNRHLLGSVLMVIGAMFVLLPKTNHWYAGDLLVICATIVAPIGNYFQQRARKKINSISLLFARNLLALPFLLIMFLFLSGAPSTDSIRHSILFIAINGVVVLGFSKIMWVEGIHRIPVTKAAALASVAPLFTILFSYIILKQPPTIWQLTAFIPMFVGLYLLTANKKMLAGEV